MAAVLRPQPSVRAMVRGDLDAVTAIDRASYPYPWSRGIFRDCLQVGYRCRVLTVNGQVSGFSIVSQAIDEAHLLNLCVHPDLRRRGLAGLMLDHAVDEARLTADRMFLEVRPSNKGAIALYRGRGFRVIGRRPGYYPAESGREDAVVMVLHLE